MEELFLDILDALRHGSAGSHDSDVPAHDDPSNTPLAPDELERIIRFHNRSIRDNAQHFSKKKVLDYYFTVKESEPERWRSWSIDNALERRLLATLRVKPRRTSSGVATITVITKPHACTSACLYCPNDVRMPKSYLADEPACQRAERTWFDPYLQVAARLRSLARMGHVTDKVELIVLGGTWDDYPEQYRIWFIAELFRALNEGDSAQTQASIDERRAFYEECGISNDPDTLAAEVADVQERVTAGALAFNRAMDALYENNVGWQAAAHMQTADLAHVKELHARNVTAAHRCVGLVIETRPDMVTCASLLLMRQLGCTKIQMGVQSLDDEVLRTNRRGITVERIAQAFALARLFGFKTHAHFMANLYRATPEGDVRGYERLVGDARFMPDEVKMYPCALIGSAALMDRYRDGSWRPYDEQTLVDVLARNVMATPAWTRISRMIRDFSSDDIVDGNKKVNLREVVEAEAARRASAAGYPLREIRHREINARRAEEHELTMEELPYRTSTGQEVFLQWVTPDGSIAGFLRLSLPDAAVWNRTSNHAAPDATAQPATHADETQCPPVDATMPFADGPTQLPVAPGEAMIREVHVYGAVAGIHQEGQAAQHRGLGKQLVERACEIARDAGYERINVISAIGTREYYRKLGFTVAHDGLYQQKTLSVAARVCHYTDIADTSARTNDAHNRTMNA